MTQRQKGYLFIAFSAAWAFRLWIGWGNSRDYSHNVTGGGSARGFASVLPAARAVGKNLAGLRGIGGGDIDYHSAGATAGAKVGSGHTDVLALQIGGNAV